jgi:hypothetical protein
VSGNPLDRTDLAIGIDAVGADVSATVGPGVNQAEVTTGAPKVKNLSVGFSVDNGQVSPGRPINTVVGESAFIGYGGQIYF